MYGPCRLTQINDDNDNKYGELAINWPCFSRLVELTKRHNRPRRQTYAALLSAAAALARRQL